MNRKGVVQSRFRAVVLPWLRATQCISLCHKVFCDLSEFP